MFTIKFFKENIKRLFKKFIDKIIQFDEFIEDNIEDIASKFFLYFSIFAIIVGIILSFKLIYFLFKM